MRAWPNSVAAMSAEIQHFSIAKYACGAANSQPRKLALSDGFSRFVGLVKRAVNFNSPVAHDMCDCGGG